MKKSLLIFFHLSALYYLNFSSSFLFFRKIPKQQQQQQKMCVCFHKRYFFSTFNYQSFFSYFSSLSQKIKISSSSVITHTHIEEEKVDDKKNKTHVRARLHSIPTFFSSSKNFLFSSSNNKNDIEKKNNYVQSSQK